MYYPLARLALLAGKAGLDPKHFPLSQYRDKSFYTMRTDALDRFRNQIGKALHPKGNAGYDGALRTNRHRIFFDCILDSGWL